MGDEDLGAVHDAARDVAGRLRDDGVAVIGRGEANRRIKRHGDLESIDHGTVRAGFAAADWDYDRHLYVDPDVVADRARELATEFHASGRPLVTREEVVERVADPVDRGDEAGWERGQFVSLLRRAFEDEGWDVRRVERPERTRTLFVLPLYDVLEAHHPNGRPPLSTDDLFSLYVAHSIEAAVLDR